MTGQHVPDRRNPPARVIANERDRSPHLAVPNFVASIRDSYRLCQKSNRLNRNRPLASLFLRSGDGSFTIASRPLRHSPLDTN